MKTAMYLINWTTEDKGCSAWIKANNINQAIKKAEKELIGFYPNKVGFSFTVRTTEGIN